jgi:hypothetical protein
MKDRFTHNSRFGRHTISIKDRTEVYDRNDYTCQYCLNQYETDNLSIDHLIPVALDGVHEIRNYVTCCRLCNSRKKHTPLKEFLRKIIISIADLPIHGDPIIDNKDLPIEIRLIRKRIFDNMRLGKVEFKGKSAQQKIEKHYRTEIWNSQTGQAMIEKYPNLPGHARIMLPEIETISKSEEDFVLLVELSKSANTRNLIGNELNSDVNVTEVANALLDKTKDISLQKRLQQALNRTRSVISKQNEPDSKNGC